MKSIREIYKTGKGPSSSHTMGPERAANYFKNAHPQADGFRVILYGSLSKTGVGHGTDRVLREVLAPVPTEIVFSDEALPASAHPNTMDLIALKNGAETDRLRVESIGGGDIRIPGQTDSESEEVYVEHSFAEIADFCKWRYIQTLSDYVELNEGPEIWAFLLDVWQTMKQSIDEGLSKTGVLPGGLNVQRKAKYLYEQHPDDENPAMKEFQMIAAYAYAVAEQNADNGTIVTAPTCGACGVLPAACGCGPSAPAGPAVRGPGRRHPRALLIDGTIIAYPFAKIDPILSEGRPAACPAPARCPTRPAGRPTAASRTPAWDASAAFPHSAGRFPAGPPRRAAAVPA